jgi:16S rRNA (cytidine1402-2'-O)-methyltransferase
MIGKLFLLPNLLGKDLIWDDFFPKKIGDTVLSLRGLYAESEKGAWRFLRHFFSQEKIATFPLRLVNEHTKRCEIEELLQPLLKGEEWGLISDAGVPILADPGSQLVFAARNKGIEVMAFSGPSSILLSLMLSGFSGQSFSFYGYLPIESISFKERIVAFEKDPHKTHIWMETPYRVQKRLCEMMGLLKEETLFCLALDLTLPTQEVIVKRIKEWKKSDLSRFHKRLAIFLMGQDPLKQSYGNGIIKEKSSFG